jgi:hypothetical protein
MPELLKTLIVGPVFLKVLRARAKNVKLFLREPLTQIQPQYLRGLKI